MISNRMQVAVKLIKKSAIENKQDLVRIKREIRIMSALKHPHVIEIYEGKSLGRLLARSCHNAQTPPARRVVTRTGSVL